MYLYINTTERDLFEIALIGKNGVIRKKKVKSERKHSEKLLASIQKLLTLSKTLLQDINGIAVVKGPGSFTSLRIGITTANALAYALQIPIFGINSSDVKPTLRTNLFQKRGTKRVVVPTYGQPPHITSASSNMGR
ncbi:tRNA (adenosine(37)-N6)-threonylcarbamoyltransferase complex dimerization subunit type 1 TsaB [bacterium]|jgi:tRNA threonylcarbamoyladenosine biosynthesis protein TsaB|nr:tRNA (adenosine(37)-N6)-threonylcarbamoyltransferase complex dimerization subunit type 1 TsaB [bacterium]MDP6571233.1 tRNA (adenosine(37)-N6)-threonylcarbamoyltransferase complex dimerization subunit type 1 TsaB [Patescibacteria group bacterium]MDP6756220.1 tRNA (adenosine(37)-N6)-threonylcarbamoyltransferase complex dimerization subunit type 1 TsaB [Patescibacteria group bacterium]|tara:strand:+ start:20810 stop:21217 length:408 start_codon:yes stop_codon:yes gene_type:complete